MIINASASHLPHSPRKVNLVAASIVGLKAEKAIEKLQFTLKRTAAPIAKVIRQAIGNAVNNHHLEATSLTVWQAYATKGRVLKKGLMGGRSRYKPFERTASHLTIKLKSADPKSAKALTPKIEKESIKKVTTKKA